MPSILGQLRRVIEQVRGISIADLNASPARGKHPPEPDEAVAGLRRGGRLCIDCQKSWSARSDARPETSFTDLPGETSKRVSGKRRPPTVETPTGRLYSREQKSWSFPSTLLDSWLFEPRTASAEPSWTCRSLKTGFVPSRRPLSRPGRFFCHPNAHFAAPTLFELPERPIFFASRFLGVPSPRLSSGTGVLASGASSFFPSRHLRVRGRRDSFGAAVRLPESASFFRRPRPPSSLCIAVGPSRRERYPLPAGSQPIQTTVRVIRTTVRASQTWVRVPRSRSERGRPRSE